VHPQFRVLFTSNPEEYAGVHTAQDALLDRMITIDIGEADLETEQLILTSRIGLLPHQAVKIISLVRSYRRYASQTKSASLRLCLMIGRICYDHKIEISGQNPDFRAICQDIILSRFDYNAESAATLSQLLDQLN